MTLVELLVVVVLLGIIGSAVLGVVVTTSRTQNRSANLAEAMSDARTSLDNMRKEIRAARRIYASSGGDTLAFWIDRDNDDVQDADEQITYGVTAIVTGRYKIERWTADAPSVRRIMAQTLLNSTPFSYDVAPPESRVVTIDMDFQVASSQTFDPLEILGKVRLRNVADPS